MSGCWAERGALLLIAGLAVGGPIGCASRAVGSDGGSSRDDAPAGDGPVGDAPCRQYAAWQQSGSTKGIEISGGGLTVTYSGIGGGAARSDEARSSGRWYWEITIAVLAAGRRHALGVINGEQSLAGGLFAATPVRPVCRYNSSGDTICGPPTWRSQQFSKFHQGDVVGVALDLDQGVLYFSSKGRWQHVSTATGATLRDDPVKGVGGLRFPAAWQQPLHAAVEVGSGDRFTANFGGSAFRYTPPKGFGPLRRSGCP